MASLIEAIGRIEGFYAKGPTPNRPQRNHNPGNIVYGKFASDHGAIASDGRFAIFPDDATGFEAMRQLLKEHYKGLTLEEAINRYAPPIENQTNAYLAFVAKVTGSTPDTIIDTLLDQK